MRIQCTLQRSKPSTDLQMLRRLWRRSLLWLQCQTRWVPIEIFLPFPFLKTFLQNFLCTTSLVRPIEIYRPCNPSPCGANALCKERDGAGSCACMKDYFGDPYLSCRPECIQNSDCDRSRACENTKCVDPCIGSCGLNAECKVRFHTPQCHCINGYTGDATQICHAIPISKFHTLKTKPNEQVTIEHSHDL